MNSLTAPMPATALTAPLGPTALEAPALLRRQAARQGVVLLLADLDADLDAQAATLSSDPETSCATVDALAAGARPSTSAQLVS